MVASGVAHYNQSAEINTNLKTVLNSFSRIFTIGEKRPSDIPVQQAHVCLLKINRGMKATEEKQFLCPDNEFGKRILSAILAPLKP